MRDHEYNYFEDWIEFIKEYTYLYSDYMKLILCLNKTDLIDINKKNEINKDLLNKSKEYNNCPVFCISMKNDDDIELMRNEIKKIAIEIIKNKELEELNIIRISLIGPSKTVKTSLIN